MFKKIKENPYVIKFKELRANPQTKAIADLILIMIFMIILVAFARSSSAYNKKSKADSTTLVFNNYEYTYKDSVKTIFGMNYNDKMEFNINNNKYYYNGKNVYLINDQTATVIPNFDLNILKINQNMLNNLTGKASYTMNGEYKHYIIPLGNFINLYEVDTEVDLTMADQYNILVEEYEKGSNISIVRVDLSNYYKFRGIADQGILTINFYNVDKLSNFTLAYDSLLGGK
jgi:hypothetical protein